MNLKVTKGNFMKALAGYIGFVFDKDPEAKKDWISTERDFGELSSYVMNKAREEIKCGEGAIEDSIVFGWVEEYRTSPDALNEVKNSEAISSTSINAQTKENPIEENEMQNKETNIPKKPKKQENGEQLTIEDMLCETENKNDASIK